MDYVLRGGDEGARRLEVLTRAKWPSTRSFLRRIPLKPGMRCLDVGCGNGSLTCHFAQSTGFAVGIDGDARILELARVRAQGLPVEFRHCTVDQLEVRDPFDFVYARYLLTHVPDAAAALRRMAQAARPGAMIVVEDIDFPGHVWHPPCPAFDRYLELYQSIVLNKGGDPAIGPKLFGLFLDAGLEEVRVQCVTPIFHRGIGKQIARITLEHIGDALIDAHLATREELESLRRELDAFALDPRSIQSMARTFQVCGRRPR